jgi:hypothetical protein
MLSHDEAYGQARSAVERDENCVKAAIGKQRVGPSRAGMFAFVYADLCAALGCSLCGVIWGFGKRDDDFVGVVRAILAQHENTEDGHLPEPLLPENLADALDSRSVGDEKVLSFRVGEVLPNHVVAFDRTTDESRFHRGARLEAHMVDEQRACPPNAQIRP